MAMKLPVKFQRRIISKMYRQESLFLLSACGLMMFYISMKFHKDVLHNFVTDGQMSDDAFYFYEVSRKCLESISS